MAYIKRSIDDELLSWMKDPSRKPLLLRGARQVGKTTAVRALAKRFKYFIEIDFNQSEADRELFGADVSTPKLWEKRM